MVRRGNMRAPKFAPGAVVWAKFDKWPWWPAVVTARKDGERLVRDPGTLRAAKRTNRLVRFFQSTGGSVAVVDVARLRPYTGNRARARDAGDYEDDVRAACDAADEWRGKAHPAKAEAADAKGDKHRTHQEKKVAPEPVLVVVGDAKEDANFKPEAGQKRAADAVCDKNAGVPLPKKKKFSESADIAEVEVVGGAFAELTATVASIGVGLDAMMVRLQKMIALKDALASEMADFRKDIADVN